MTTNGSAVTLEICASSIQSVLKANKARAHRIELCSNLEQGGITPSYGLIKQAVLQSEIPINVLIRPRAGNFVYDEDEIHIMFEDIQMCKQLGCHGVVVGVLTEANVVDTKCLRELVTHAHPLPVTFHRAFEDCNDKTRALEDIIAAGCTRILTSGGFSSAEHGIDVLRDLVKLAASRIEIMPGAGVVPANVAKIVKYTGAREIHASVKSVSTRYRSHAKSRFDVDIWETDTDLIESLLKELETVMK